MENSRLEGMEICIVLAIGYLLKREFKEVRKQE